MTRSNAIDKSRSRAAVGPKRYIDTPQGRRMVQVFSDINSHVKYIYPNAPGIPCTEAHPTIREVDNIQSWEPY